MPKRKHDDKESLEKIKKKIKKLERKLLKGRRRYSSSSDSMQASEPQDDILVSESNEYLPAEVEPVPSTSVSCLESLKVSTISNAPQEVPDSLPQPTIEEATVVEHEEHELDESVLEILGADPLKTSSLGKDIQKDLAIRYEYIATSGLTKELRKEFIDSHLPPANCKLIDAPSLNPEIKAAVTDVVVKRDKAIQLKQKQLCCAIACLSEAITSLMSKENIDKSILKLLVDTGRILCDCQHSDSITRRNFILAVLKKELKDQMLLTKIDSLLFGQELADTLKTAKAINKSGAELKSVSHKNLANKPKPPPINRNLNWKTPAPTRRQTGTRRAKESAPPTKQPRAHSSRVSRPSSSTNSRSRH